MLKEAIAELEKAARLSQGASLYAAFLAHAYAVTGKRSEAETLLQRTIERGQHAYVPSLHLAIIYVGLER